MKAVIYARISLREEDIEVQINAVKKWAEDNGYTIAGVFRDTISGAIDPMKREGFSTMLKFCNENNIKTILIYDLSRLGRSLPEAVNVLRTLTQKGFAVIFTRYNLKADLKDIAGKVMIYTLSMAAELERDFYRMRVEAAKRAGKICHRPPMELPMDLIKKLIDRGWSYREIYAYLIGAGHLKYKTSKGEERTMTYVHFLRRLRKAGLKKKRRYRAE